MLQFLPGKCHVGAHVVSTGLEADGALRGQPSSEEVAPELGFQEGLEGLKLFLLLKGTPTSRRPVYINLSMTLPQPLLSSLPHSL